jgi:uncharacterized protein (DUF58 family)
VREAGGVIPKELLKALRKIEITTNRLATDKLSGSYTSVFKGQGLAFREVRPYQPGDDVRTIDWNVSARMNDTFVKVYVERRMTVMLVVDASRARVRTRAGKARVAAEVARSARSAPSSTTTGRAQFGIGTDQKIVPRKGPEARHARRAREF